MTSNVHQKYRWLLLFVFIATPLAGCYYMNPLRHSRGWGAYITAVFALSAVIWLITILAARAGCRMYEEQDQEKKNDL